MTDPSKRHFSSAAINELEKQTRTNLINCLSGYKGANLVGTTDGKRDNLAIISSVFHVGAHPPLQGMLLRPHTVPRQTLENIRETGVYTINAVSAGWTDKAHQTSARYDEHTSEFDATGLTPLKEDGFAASFVAQSPLRMAMAAEEITTLQCNKTVLVIGRVLDIYVMEGATGEDGQLDLEKMNLACISGLDTYHRAERIARYAYAKPDNPVTLAGKNT